jgi:hypothetical protein
MADDAAYGRDDVNQRNRKENIKNAGARDVAERAQPGIECDAVEQPMQGAKRQKRQKLERSK